MGQQSHPRGGWEVMWPHMSWNSGILGVETTSAPLLVWGGCLLLVLVYLSSSGCPDAVTQVLEQ